MRELRYFHENSKRLYMERLYKLKYSCSWLLTTEDVLEILQKHAMGLYHKAKNRQRLNNCDQSKLSRTIISYILSTNYKLKLGRDALVHLCSVIMEIFPHENPETYYTPSQDGKMCRGKLYNSYQHYRYTASKYAAELETRNTLNILMPYMFMDARSNEPPIKIRYDFAGPFNKLLTLNEFLNLLKEKAYFLYEKSHQNVALENRDQNFLVRLLIEHLLDKDVEIELGKKSLLYLFTLIKRLFPGEKLETYYVPSMNRRPTSGKLYKRFQNRRLELKKHGLIRGSNFHMLYGDKQNF
ncbi:hypothetical protein DMENIID0001_125610 [Sergentomyia squamirostris]